MKTNTETVAKPMIPMLMYSILKGYCYHPFWLMLGTTLTFNRFKKGIRDDFPDDLVKTSGFIVHLYQRLQRKMSQEEAFEVVRVVLLSSANVVMQANFRNVEAPRTFENLIKYQQKTNQEGITKQNEMTVLEQNKHCYRFKMTRCMFYEFFKAMGVPELTTIMCSVDNAVFNSYKANEIIFSRGVGKTIADGADSCEFCVKSLM